MCFFNNGLPGLLKSFPEKYNSKPLIKRLYPVRHGTEPKYTQALTHDHFFTCSCSQPLSSSFKNVLDKLHISLQPVQNFCKKALNARFNNGTSKMCKCKNLDTSRYYVPTYQEDQVKVCKLQMSRMTSTICTINAAVGRS